jgi:hypothetical protein
MEKDVYGQELQPCQHGLNQHPAQTGEIKLIVPTKQP